MAEPFCRAHLPLYKAQYSFDFEHEMLQVLTCLASVPHSLACPAVSTTAFLQSISCTTNRSWSGGHRPLGPFSGPTVPFLRATQSPFSGPHRSTLAPPQWVDPVVEPIVHVALPPGSPAQIAASIIGWAHHIEGSSAGPHPPIASPCAALDVASPGLPPASTSQRDVQNPGPQFLWLHAKKFLPARTPIQQVNVNVWTS